MAIKYKFSDHAIRRFRQRFNHIGYSLEYLIENSIIFGGQLGSEYLLLNEKHKIVFPIIFGKDEIEHTVKTVLTLDQAKANLSWKHGILFDSSEEIKSRVEKNRAKSIEKKPEQPEKIELIEDANKKVIIEDAKKKAKDFFEKYGYFPEKEEIKKIKKELGFSNRILSNYFLPELGRLIRENRFFLKRKKLKK